MDELTTYWQVKADHELLSIDDPDPKVKQQQLRRKAARARMLEFSE